MFWKKKIGEFKCPRCGKKQHFDDEQSFKSNLERPYLLCDNCLAPLKLKAEGNNVVSVERILGQIDIELDVFTKNCGHPCIERSMLDSESQILKQTVGMLDGSEISQRGEREIAMGYAWEGESQKSLFWQKEAAYEPPWKEDLNRLFVKYPGQVLVILFRWNKTEHLMSISKNCFRCEFRYPKSFSKCPFCGYES